MLYEGPAFRAAIGITGRQDYLLARAPNYDQTEFVNGILGGVSKGQISDKTMIFWPHVYYLQAPYVIGDPEINWDIDPARHQTAEEWRALFREEHIGWVVRAPEYPDIIAGPLQALETQGVLVPIAQTEVNDFAGMRFTGRKESFDVVVLQVRE